MRNTDLTLLTSSFKQLLFCLTLIAIFGCGSDADGQNSSNSAGTICGGLLGKKCTGENEFCKFKEGTCGQGDQTGECTVKPEICAEIYGPVIGCDGKTYPNDCSAFSAGVSVKQTLNPINPE